MSKGRQTLERYYHGGPIGLEAILPPAQTGARTCIQSMLDDRLNGEDPGEDQLLAVLLCADRDCVYVTPDLVIARFYATGRIDSGYGAIYQVRPSDDLRPDRVPGSFSCSSAEIIRIHSFVAERDYGKYKRALDRSYPGQEGEITKDDSRAMKAKLSKEMRRKFPEVPERHREVWMDIIHELENGNG